MGSQETQLVLLSTATSYGNLSVLINEAVSDDNAMLVTPVALEVWITSRFLAIRNASKGPNTPASARSFRHSRNYYEGKITKMIEEEKLIVDDLKMLVQQCSELHDTAK